MSIRNNLLKFILKNVHYSEFSEYVAIQFFMYAQNYENSFIL